MIQINIPMPKCCADCPLYDDRWDYPTCYVTQKSRGYDFPIHKKRMDECPLVEPPKSEMIQDLIDKTTVNAGAAQPIIEGTELISTGYNSHDCESFYKCPFCGHEYSSWGLFHKGIKTKSDFECFQCGKLLYYR